MEVKQEPVDSVVGDKDEMVVIKADPEDFHTSR